MYFENNHRAAENRADADFLRRMLGGELNGNRCNRSDNRPCERSGNRSCDRLYDRTPAEPRRGTTMGECCEWTPSTPRVQARQEMPPVRPDGGCGCQKPCDTSCPTEVPAPSLAMVYSPRQCWRSLLEPEVGLKHGSIFAELILPFEGSQIGGKEGCPHHLM